MHYADFLQTRQGTVASFLNPWLNEKPRDVHHYCTLMPCGSRHMSTKGEFVEILEFTHFTRVFKFSGQVNFGRKKEIFHEIKVSVGFELV